MHLKIRHFAAQSSKDLHSKQCKNEQYLVFQWNVTSKKIIALKVANISQQDVKIASKFFISFLNQED